VIVLDAYALEAFLNLEAAGPLVRDLILSGEQILMPSVNLAETADRMIRLNGSSRDELENDLLGLGITISSLDAAAAFDAAALRATHYHRSRRAVSLADCCAAALALDRDALLVSSDPALLGMMHDEGGRYLALPDSSGQVWSLSPKD
jgi:PIN domain nuclease of toxin-antitoxin system